MKINFNNVTAFQGELRVTLRDSNNITHDKEIITLPEEDEELEELKKQLCKNRDQVMLTRKQANPLSLFLSKCLGGEYDIYMPITRETKSKKYVDSGVNRIQLAYEPGNIRSKGDKCIYISTDGDEFTYRDCSVRTKDGAADCRLSIDYTPESECVETVPIGGRIENTKTYEHYRGCGGRNTYCNEENIQGYVW